MKEKKWVIGVVCFLLTFLITVQVRTINQSSSDILRLKKENELRDEINQWKDIYATATEKIGELNRKIADYQEAIAKDDKDSAVIKTELDNANILAGLTKVEGQGIVITLDDTKALEKIAIDAGFYDPNVYVIHDSDLVMIVNELIAAGAEAISINDQRITSISEIRCTGPQIQINGIRMVAPFKICAIGESTTLEGALKLRGGIIDSIKSASIEVAIEKNDEITIDAYNKPVSFKYASVVEEGGKN